MSKTHWKKLVNPEYLGVYSLDEGKDMIVTIKAVSRQMVKGADGKDQECTVATLDGQKPLIVNRTNAKTIAKVAGSPYIEDWQGVSITLYPLKVKAFGDIVEALRVRAQKPQMPKLEEITPTHPAWQKCKEAVQSGNFTIEQIKSKYSITTENEAILCSK